MSLNNPDKAPSEQESNPKSSYTSPTLTVYGNLGSITQGNKAKGQDGGNQGSDATTHA